MSLEQIRRDIAGLRRDELRNAAGRVYMRRYHVRYRKSGCLRVHEILESDDDRDLHDHPWDFRSKLLNGSYIETTPGGDVQYDEGAVLVRPAVAPHRLTLVDGPVWTLFEAGPVARRWGFHTEQGWVPWRAYEARHRPERRKW